jgi:Domain of unknown function (DUF4326)
VPDRIQLRRSPGWRKPPGTIVVARPSRWGNPFVVGRPAGGVLVRDRADAVELYRQLLADSPEERAAARSQLAGRDLACWCPLRAADGSRGPCHADVLLEIANS